ncbi:MAG: alpha-N-acetylglucosaminidase [Muribaculum sp.]|nr:alpha-N-acetylglucosaminidase [Muribaculum sp.]
MEFIKKIGVIIVAFMCFALTAIAKPDKASENLLDRVCPGGKGMITFEIRSDKGGIDYFEIGSKSGRPHIVGSNSVSIATGLNWYLKHFCGINLTWNNMQATLPACLPIPEEKVRKETSLTMRYDFNYCTFSYSMAFWDWSRWEKEIDWMALHGINMPLAIVGMESAWRNMLKRLGYSEEEVGDFIAGPGFLAWWAMNNLEGWGGPLPSSWYANREKLQKNILSRMKEYGMTPVLPGYCGMMPHDADKRLGLNLVKGGPWNGYVRPGNLLPTDPRFDEIADIYYEELTRLYGKSEFYSMDPFHEMGDVDVDYAKAGLKLLDAMKRCNRDAKWVIQGWTENPRQQMLDVLPVGQLVILDLFSECRPMWGIPSVWKREEGYGHHQWLFCMLENFGANVGLHGRMDQLIDNFRQTKTNPLASSLKGIGLTMEGSGNNPVMFELMCELPWMGDDIPSKEQWIEDYVKCRYGCADTDMLAAWNILIAGIYNCPAGNNQQGPHESIFCGRPSTDNFQVKSWSKMRNYYDPATTLRAAMLMADASDRLRGNNNYEYDLVDVTRQALADQGRRQYQRAMSDYRTFSREDFKSSSRRFLDMIILQDKLLATRREFRLGSWLEAARSLGTTNDEKDLYEWNARVQITTWGNRECADVGGLRDYAHKEWQGLLKDFYYPRWQKWMEALSNQMDVDAGPRPDALGGGPNANKTSSELFAMALPSAPVIDWYALEEPWTLGKGGYSSVAIGDPIATAKEILQFLNE